MITMDRFTEIVEEELALLPEYAHEPVREAEQGGRVDAARRHARIAHEHEVPAVQKRHQVDDE